MKYIIEAWNQPHGPGHGWAPCSDRKAELFFVWGRNGRLRSGEFKTKAAAREFVARRKAEDKRGRK